MIVLFTIKRNLKTFYERNYRVVRPILRLFFALFTFSVINHYFGFHEQASSIFVTLILSLVCAMTPDVIIVYFAVFLSSFQVFALSPLLGIGFLFINLMALLLFSRYQKEQCSLALLIPLLTPFQMVYAVPVVAALYASPIVLPAIIIGILLRFICLGIVDISGTSVLESSNMLEHFRYVADYVMQNRQVLIYLVAFILAFMATYLIRKGKWNHASQIGILIGSIVQMAGLLIGNILWEGNMDIVLIMVGVVSTMLIAYVIQFFRMSLDYTGTRKMQFEDEEYYYYVKAVPKIKVMEQEKTVTRITPDTNSELTEDTEDLQEAFERAFDEERLNK